MPRIITGAQLKQTFTTTFPLTENPISQSGIWIQQDPNQTKVQTATGFAYGTQTGTGGFNDSQAYQNGWGADYSVEGTVYIKPGTPTGVVFREVEILLRCTDTTSAGSMVNHAYEINVAWDGGYANIGRFFGAALVSVGNNSPGNIGFTPATGDKFKCTMVGQTITCYWNGTQFMQTTDNDPSLKITSGGPGIGFYIEKRATDPVFNDEFRFSQLTIQQL